MYFSYLANAPTSYKELEEYVQDAYNFNKDFPDEIIVNEKEPFFDTAFYRGSMTNMLIFVTVSPGNSQWVTLTVTKDQYVPMGTMYIYKERMIPSHMVPSTPIIPENAYKHVDMGCDHEYTRYEGLINRFDYCTKCDDKKEIV